MNIKRKLRQSIYYWLSSLVPTGVNVEDGFPSGKLLLPTVSVVSLDIRGVPFELGGCELDKEFWRIDIFAEDTPQRDELAFLIFDALEQQIPVYNYDEGFPPGASPTQIGYLIVSDRVLKPIYVFKDLVEKLYWRAGITFYTYYQPS